MNWAVERAVGSAGDFHARELPEPLVPAVWVLEVDRPAMVLGSTQGDDVVDRRAAEAGGVEVVRRRSGGGAVLLRPRGVTWVDVLVPVDHPRWEADVSRSFDWLGRAWAAALTALDPGTLPVVHRGPLQRTRWSRLVCFAGSGPGEVRVDGAKVVGLAQRRTRAGARFQCALLHRWGPEGLVDLLALAPDERDRAAADLAPLAAGIVVAPSAAVDALLGELARS